MTVRHSRPAVALVPLLALLAACGDGAAGGPGSGSSVSGPVVAHTEKGDGSGSAAQIVGPLTLSDGCLLVGEFPVVWPYGTTWDAEDQAVQLPDNQVVALGVRVSGGGGYPYLSDLGPQFARPLADCPLNEYEEVAMFNSQGEITVGE